ncbi:hypothetical protein BTW36_003406 [Escherichia coli]|nr:hypothetical protein [Escherichia coli]
MKLVGSYTSPFVRKLSILLLEKGITFEFINELPYNADNGVAQFNPYSAAIFLIPICISFDTAEKRRYATYLILNRRFSFEF